MIDEAKVAIALEFYDAMRSETWWYLYDEQLNQVPRREIERLAHEVFSRCVAPPPPDPLAQYAAEMFGTPGDE